MNPSEREPDIDFMFVQVRTEPPLTQRERRAIKSAIFIGWASVVLMTTFIAIKLVSDAGIATPVYPMLSGR